MIQEERKTTFKDNSSTVQNLILENREKLTISGVIDVLSFDDQIVILETQLGMLTIKGDDLRINKFRIDTQHVTIQGNINTLTYSEKEEKKNGSLLGKIFK